ncbi:hypothetical protein KUTeg_002899 [Tegillarca granosa]|uniref:TIR domain-containing protein n=1 Tax=Tegillarca granosa TaxID=220873 RepID=A0ABQ9FQJ4_TEGGR|nr:hypothetical protein KUTeg_002899 [Tegillarca granosa]
MVPRELRFCDAPALPKGKDFHLYFTYHCSSPEREKMKAIVRELEFKGFRCYVFERDFNATKSIAANIRYAIERCLKIVILLSSAYIKNEWNHFEMEVLTYPKNDKLFCIPVLMEPCDIPPFLKYSKFINATGAKETWWDKFLYLISGEVIKLPRRKRFHVFIAHAPSDSSMAEQIADDLESPHIGLVCCYPSRDFKTNDPFSKSLEYAMKRSVKMIILFSEEFVNHYWKKFYEGKIRIRHQISVLLDDARVPTAYHNIVTIDARKDKNEWFSLLLGAVKGDSKNTVNLIS